MRFPNDQYPRYCGAIPSENHILDYFGHEIQDFFAGSCCGSPYDHPGAWLDVKYLLWTKFKLFPCTFIFQHKTETGEQKPESRENYQLRPELTFCTMWYDHGIKDKRYALPPIAPARSGTVHYRRPIQQQVKYHSPPWHTCLRRPFSGP